VRYVFADTEVAERRLALVAEVFAPMTTAFLRGAAAAAPELAVDLGCGPGHTTRLLASVVQSARTVGLDGSARFIEAARASAADGVEFLVHDVNIPAWHDHPYVREHYGVKTLVRLADELAAIAAEPVDVSDIAWEMRELVFEHA
jgi:SAM-dependent methyltransferase